MTIARTFGPNGEVATVPGTFDWTSGRMQVLGQVADLPSERVLLSSTR